MGRCKIYCVDIAGETLVCANVYGWSGGVKGSKEAERTDDILAIVRMQFKRMAPGPKLICGDFNAQRGCLPNLETMLGEEGWTDVGDDNNATGGKPGQFTCHANAKVKKSRIDYFIVNDYLAPAVKGFEVINDSNFPTHRPIRMRIAVAQLKTVTNQLRRPTNYATLFQEKVDKDVKAKQEEMDAEAEAKGEKSKKADENEIRKNNLSKLHGLMDKHIKEREPRIKRAVDQKNTTMQWDLIAAAVEAANIEFHGLTAKEATKMRGRSKITFQKKQCDILHHEDDSRDNDDFDNKLKWLNKVAGQHAKLGNKLIATAKRIKSCRLPQGGDPGLGGSGSKPQADKFHHPFLHHASRRASQEALPLR